MTLLSKKNNFIFKKMTKINKKNVTNLVETNDRNLLTTRAKFNNGWF